MITPNDNINDNTLKNNTLFIIFHVAPSVSRFQEKEKRGEMITKNVNNNINDNTHPVQGKMITQK
jgi:hypothetical protein